MKRLIILLTAICVGGWVLGAAAGDFHVGTSLDCSDCHVAHYSQSHGYTSGGSVSPALGPSGPYSHLLRNEVNELCLACHDNKSWAPDVFGANGGTAGLRLAGGLNAAAGHRSNDPGYDEIDGHTLWSTATAPGGTFAHAGDGLECTDCHMQHGHIPTQYRNVWSSSNPADKFFGKSLTYAIGTNVLTADVYERSAASYTEADVDYNEPDVTKSAYGAWCGSCHVNFHGSGADPNMGGVSGGSATSVNDPWLRHPVADVDVGSVFTHISSLAQFNSHTNRVKVLDSQGLWDGTAADNTVTPSCMSCHKSHGNQNSFGMIFMTGTGTRTEQGDGGIYKDLCRQCHVQGG